MNIDKHFICHGALYIDEFKYMFNFLKPTQLRDVSIIFKFLSKCVLFLQIAIDMMNISIWRPINIDDDNFRHVRPFIFDDLYVYVYVYVLMHTVCKDVS